MINSWNSKLLILIASFLLIVFCNFINSYVVHAVAVFPGSEKPFGTTYDEWVAKFWNWWLSLSAEGATPKPDGCLANKLGSLVMMLEVSEVSDVHQTCEISSSQGIMIPLWVAWCDNITDKDRIRANANLSQELSRCARDYYSVGDIDSNVKIDGVPLADLDVINQFRSGEAVYKVNSLTNITTLRYWII